MSSVTVSQSVFVSKAPEVTVSLAFPRVDGKDLTFTQISAVPEPGAPNIATVSMNNKTIIVEVRPQDLKPYPDPAGPTVTYFDNF